MQEFQSTPPVKAATLFRAAAASTATLISIHAAREGGDYLHDVESANYDISIHAAREGGDLTAAWAQQRHGLFQSTPPVKAATAQEAAGTRR